MPRRYNIIVCDLERRCTIDLLLDREGSTVADWLARHPGIEIVYRDRGSGFREGGQQGRFKGFANPRPLAPA